MPDVSKDSDSATIRIDGTGEVLRIWQDYTFASEFLTPSDAWSVTLGDSRLYEEWRPKLPPLTRVTLEINGRPQMAGVVDGWTIDTSRGGTTMKVTGRDRLGPMVAACVDPEAVQFSAGQTLLDVIVRVATPFGFTVISTTDLANRSVVTGNNPKRTIRTTTSAVATTLGTTYEGGTAISAPTQTALVPVTTEYDPTRPRDLKTYTLQQLKPHWGEGAFAFLERLCKRFGLWLWCDALGDTLIVGQPDFDQEPSYVIARRAGAGANYEEASLQVNAREQPTVIVCKSKSARNPNFPKTSGHVAMVNELTGLDSAGRILPAVQQIINAHKGCRVLPTRPIVAENARYFGPTQAVVPMFLEDDESRSIDQLEGFCRKEMGVRQGKALAYTATMPGHSQDGRIWSVNTTVRVDDSVTGATGTWWVRECAFTKSRNETRTRLSLVPVHLLEIGA